MYNIKRSSSFLNAFSDFILYVSVKFQKQNTSLLNTREKERERESISTSIFFFRSKAYDCDALCIPLIPWHWLCGYRITEKKVNDEKRKEERKKINGNVITAFNINTIELKCIFVKTQKLIVI